MTNKFTPWTIGRLLTLNGEEYPGLGSWWVQIRSGPDNDNVVARVYGDDKDKIYKNAALISSAPDLLVCAEYLLNDMRLWDVPTNCVEKLIAAIRKARGEE